jgi:thiamine kinase-like enzyme
MEHLTPSALTACLKRGKSLNQGEVLSVQTENFHATNATNTIVTLTYSPKALPPPPSRLFVKHCRQWGEFEDFEVRWYTTLAPNCPHLTPIPCYGFEVDTEQGSYTLLLHDLTETHTANWNHEPTLERHKPLIEQCAALHAGWWNHADLAKVDALPSETVITQALRLARAGKEQMLAHATLTEAERDTIEQVFATHPQRLISRAEDTSTLTCIHGDLNPGNLLSPHAPELPSYLIDYQPFTWSLKVWLGVSDLAYMMVHWWEPEVRRALEMPLLNYYHQKLEEFGVQNYPLDQCREDYRLCVAQSLYVASAWCADVEECETMDWVWKPQLRRTLVALQDWSL